MKLSRVFRLLYLKAVEMQSAVKKAKLVGVQCGENLHIYGHIGWGSEPWLIKIGNNVHLTDGIRFVTHDGGTLILRDKVPDLEITKPITIGDNVYIGLQSLILPGVTIGNNVVIGARSVVTRDIPDNSVAVGQPARVIKTIEEYQAKLEKESLHLGHLQGKEKDDALKKYFGYEG